MRLPLLPLVLLLSLAAIAAACGGASEVAISEQPTQPADASEVTTGEQPKQPAGVSEGDTSKPPGILASDLFLTFKGARYEAVDLVPILGPPVERMVQIGVAELADVDSHGELKVYRRLGEPGPAIYTETFDPTELPGGDQENIGRAQLWIRWMPAQ